MYSVVGDNQWFEEVANIKLSKAQHKVAGEKMIFQVAEKKNILNLTKKKAINLQNRWILSIAKWKLFPTYSVKLF